MTAVATFSRSSTSTSSRVRNGGQSPDRYNTGPILMANVCVDNVQKQTSSIRLVCMPEVVKIGEPLTLEQDQR